MADGLEPLALQGVQFAPGAREALQRGWEAAEAARRSAACPACQPAGSPALPPPEPPLFDSAAAFIDLVQQVLSRDIRATHVREAAAAAAAAAEPPLLPEPPAEEVRGSSRGRWRVVLDGVNVGYDIDGRGVVKVTDAHPRAADEDG
jgi:hypothetical protein